jgi:hypothetical protein
MYIAANITNMCLPVTGTAGKVEAMYNIYM